MKLNYILTGLTALFLGLVAHGQTMIINEVSNGPAGNQEYVEFVVVDNTVTYDCGQTTPPCIDIRGWIFDDNSGYHGNAGVAPGAARFSNDPLWSCVPLGTIIVIYAADRNVDIPADDFSLADGNCRLIVPLDDPTYFEFTATTPGDIVCDYPSTGWGTDPSATWIDNTVLANGGDCARLIDLNGCEVFSLCYGNADQNQLIYFSGNGGDKVWSFQTNNPSVQSNWIEGCAGDPGACTGNDQTPGEPNSALNAEYIAQFNNGCAPITPIEASAVGTDGACGCTGSADASATGSIPGYTYVWFDNTYTPIGQTGSNATGLCDGTYHVIATSLIGCEDTATVSITNPATGPNPGVGATLNLCDNGSPINFFDSITNTPSTGGIWSGPSTLSNGDQGTFDPTTDFAGDYYYIVGQGTACEDSATITISLSPPPTISINQSGLIEICPGDTIHLSAISSEGNYDWSNGLGTDTIIVSNPGSYFAIATNGCAVLNSDTAIIEYAAGCGPVIPTGIILPNIFTPNNDDLNDDFEIVAYSNVTAIEGFIVNRWGQVMFNWEKLTDKWDGTTLKGKDAPEGTYFYVLDVSYNNGSLETLKGSILLER